MTPQPVYRLLAVDDNHLNLGLFQLFLTQLGHEVVAIGNPFDAIELAKNETFDLILTDIQMPGMTGIEASAEIRRNGFTGPIIAITAHLSKLEEDELEHSDVDAILIKPVTKNDLSRLITQWLDSEQTGDRSFIQTSITTKKASPSAVYDLDLALARANDSKPLVVEMMALLVESLTPVLDTLDHQADPEALRQSLHQLTGGVRFTGAAQLEAELEHVRHQLKAGEITKEDIDGLKQKIRDVIEYQSQQPNPFET